MPATAHHYNPTTAEERSSGVAIIDIALTENSSSNATPNAVAAAAAEAEQRYHAVCTAAPLPPAPRRHHNRHHQQQQLQAAVLAARAAIVAAATTDSSSFIGIDGSVVAVYHHSGDAAHNTVDINDNDNDGIAAMTMTINHTNHDTNGCIIKGAHRVIAVVAEDDAAEGVPTTSKTIVLAMSDEEAAAGGERLEGSDDAATDADNDDDDATTRSTTTNSSVALLATAAAQTPTLQGRVIVADHDDRDDADDWDAHSHMADIYGDDYYYDSDYDDGDDDYDGIMALQAPAIPSSYFVEQQQPIVDEVNTCANAMGYADDDRDSGAVLVNAESLLFESMSMLACEDDAVSNYCCRGDADDDADREETVAERLTFSVPTSNAPHHLSQQQHQQQQQQAFCQQPLPPTPSAYSHHASNSPFFPPPPTTTAVAGDVHHNSASSGWDQRANAFVSYNEQGSVGDYAPLTPLLDVFGLPWGVVVRTHEEYAALRRELFPMMMVPTVAPIHLPPPFDPSYHHGDHNHHDHGHDHFSQPNRPRDGPSDHHLCDHFGGGGGGPHGDADAGGEYAAHHAAAEDREEVIGGAYDGCDRDDYDRDDAQDDTHHSWCANDTNADDASDAAHMPIAAHQHHHHQNSHHSNKTTNSNTAALSKLERAMLSSGLGKEACEQRFPYATEAKAFPPRPLRPLLPDAVAAVTRAVKCCYYAQRPHKVCAMGAKCYHSHDDDDGAVVPECNDDGNNRSELRGAAAAAAAEKKEKGASEKKEAKGAACDTDSCIDDAAAAPSAPTPPSAARPFTTRGELASAPCQYGADCVVARHSAVARRIGFTAAHKAMYEAYVKALRAHTVAMGHYKRAVKAQQAELEELRVMAVARREEQRQQQQRIGTQRHRNHYDDHNHNHQNFHAHHHGHGHHHIPDRDRDAPNLLAPPRAPVLSHWFQHPSSPFDLAAYQSMGLPCQHCGAAWEGARELPPSGDAPHDAAADGSHRRPSPSPQPAVRLAHIPVYRPNPNYGVGGDTRREVKRVGVRCYCTVCARTFAFDDEAQLRAYSEWCAAQQQRGGSEGGDSVDAHMNSDGGAHGAMTMAVNVRDGDGCDYPSVLDQKHRGANADTDTGGGGGCNDDYHRLNHIHDGIATKSPSADGHGWWGGDRGAATGMGAGAATMAAADANAYDYTSSQLPW